MNLKNKMPKIILMVVDELPSHGRNGYSTYNRAFLDSFISSGHEVHICITGPRLPSIGFKAEVEYGSSKPIFHYLHAFKFKKLWLPSSRSSFTRAVHASLPARFRSLLKNSYPVLSKRGNDSSLKSAVIGRPLSAAEAALVARLADELDPDWVFVDTLFRAGFIPLLQSSPKLALIAHDVFYQRCQSLSAQGTKAKPWVSEAQEADALQSFDRIIAISDDDALLLQALVPMRSVVTLTAPIPSVRYKAHTASNKKRVLYIGSRAHHNVQGLNWFLEEVWPAVLGAVPDATLDVVGSICDDLQGCKNVTLHGRVDDIQDVASAANFAVNPVLAGSGLKIKVLDYLSHGLPCITTIVGGTGFPMTEPSPITLCNSAAEFIKKMEVWLKQPDSVEVSRDAIPEYLNYFSLNGFNDGLSALVHDKTIKKTRF